MKNIGKVWQRFISRPSEAAVVTPAAFLMPLEPRIVYDASVAGVGAASHHPFHGAERSTHVDNSPSAAEPFRIAPVPAAVAAAPTNEARGFDSVTARGPQHPVERSGPSDNQVVFIDPNVTDYQSLVAGLPSGTQYVVLNQKTDGLEQMAVYLQAHPGIEAVHLLSHGSEAQVQVGGTLLDTADLSRYSAELAQIGAALKPGAELLIYGCDVAEGSDGRALVQQIAALSHLNVAASTGLVGAASLGGSWTLDYDVGATRVPVIFSRASEQRYDFLLSQTIEDYTSNPGFDSGFTSQFTLDGITYTIVKSGPQGDNNIGVDPTLQQLPDEGGLGNALQFDQNEPGGAPSGGISSITISLADGHAFNFSSLDIDVTAGSSPTNGTVSFTASNGITSPTVIASNGNATSTTVSFSGQSAFQDTRSLTISGSNLLVNLGHLVYTDVPSPVLSASSGTTNYVGGTAAKAVDSAATVTDTSLGTLGNAATGTVTIGSHSSGDALSFTGSAATGNITATYSNYVLTLTSANGSATATQWTNAFDAVNFSSSSTTYGNRSITFVLNDGTTNSNTTTKTLDVINPLPVLTADSGSANFSTSNDVAHVPSAPVVIDSNLGLSDAASSTIQSATVSISGNAQTSTDVLNYTNTASDGNILGSYNAGVLTLTSAGNSATLAQCKAALDSVSFTSSAAVPSNATRTISFSVTDANNHAGTATRLVTVTDVDQIPVITIGSGTTNYVGGTSAVAVDTSIGVSDVDSVNQRSGTVSISNGFSAGDTLAFIPNNILYGNITGSYNTNNGTLTLTGSATDQQWANAFNSVTFSAASSTTSGVRTVSFIVNDGTFNSTAATKTVTVTAPPVITTDSGSANFATSNNVASVPSTPVLIDSTLGLVDSGSGTEVSATVSITGNYQNTDVLGFTSNASFGNIVGSYNAGVLTLTSAGNSATLAQWKAALDSVSFTSTAAVPSNATRTISFSITDLNNSVSNTATRLVTVTDVDQIPVLSIGNGTTNYVGGTAAVEIDTNIGVSDVDSTNQASGTVRISNGFSAGDTLAFTSNNILYGNITGSYNTNNGTLTLTGSATDQQWANAFNSVTFSAASSTTSGVRTVSFIVNDGTFNSTAATKTVTVTAPPVITTDSGSANFSTSNNVASVPSTPVLIDPGLGVADNSVATLASARVAITGNFQAGEDVLSFVNDGLTMGNIDASYNPPTGVLTLTSAGASATLAQWQAAMRSVSYADYAITPDGAVRTISFEVTDLNNNVSNTATRLVTVTDVDQIPVITVGSGTTNYVGGTAAVAVDTRIGVSDVDSVNQVSGTVSISNGFSAGDTLAFVPNNILYGNITGSYNTNNGTLTLTGSATDQQWANAFNSVTFSAATTTTPGSRTVSFVVNDGTFNSAAATKTVTVTAPPVITTDSGSANFSTSNNVASVPSTPVLIDSTLGLVDSGSGTEVSATVSISGNYQNTDVLGFTGNASFGNIVGSYNAGVLTLTSAGNSATIAQWKAALDSVTFTSTAAVPSDATRTISFSVTDLNNSVSNTATRLVTVTDVDQIPVVTIGNGTTNYVGGTAAVAIDTNIGVSDVDSVNQVSGTVSISNGFSAGDTLAFVPNNILYGNITGSYNTNNGTLTLTGSATDQQWANAFNSVTFSAASTTTPGSRTVSFVVNDGTFNSTAVTKTVDVTAPPLVATTSGSAAFTAGDDVVSTPVAVDPGLSFTDASASIIQSASLSISANFEGGKDVLNFANNDAATFGNLAGTYSAGVLTLSSSGNTATLAQWQAALDAVTYTSTAITPSTLVRTVSINLTDANGNVSNTATRNVTVADVDQTPLVTTSGATTIYVGGTTAIPLDSGVTIGDTDNATQSSGTVSIGAGFHAGDMLAFTNTNATLFGNIGASYDRTTGVLTLASAGATSTDAQWANALNAVSFSAAAGAAPGYRSIAFVTNDGTKGSAAANGTVDVLGPPSVTVDAGSAVFIAGDNRTSTPIVVDSGIGLADASSRTLASGTVSITENFRAGEDVLSFVNDGSTMGNIEASYNAGTGVLTLTSAGASATLAQWQAAMQSVTYTDSAITPDGAIRAISFGVIDGNGNASNSATRAVTVADTDQTPVLTASLGNTGYVAGAGAVAADSGIVLSDRDNGTQSEASVSIGRGFTSGDTLSFANTSLNVFGNISASYDPTSGVMTLISVGRTASDAQWTSALEAVEFSAGSNAAPGARTIFFSINDGTKTSVAVTKLVEVTAPPSLTVDPGAASFVAADNAVSTPVAVDAGIAVSDQASLVLASATVSVTGNFHPGEDVLSFSNSGGTVGNISGTYDAAAGVLRLTSTGASATLAQWQAALQSVTYSDTAVTPNAAPRTISFSVVDGSGNTSSPVFRTVTVQDTDQTPIVLATGGVTAYEVGSTPTTIDGGISISDRDNTTLASATVSVGAGFRSGDRLSLGSGGAAYGNIAASYDATTGVLTLSSSGSTALVSQWQAALDAVQFSSAVTTLAGNRTIAFAVDDGTESSTLATKTVAVSSTSFVPAKMPLAAIPSPADDVLITDNLAFAGALPSMRTVTFSSGPAAGGAPDGSLGQVGLGDGSRYDGSDFSSSVSNEIQYPGAWQPSRSWLPAPMDLQRSSGVGSPTERLDVALRQPFSLALTTATEVGSSSEASSMSLEQLNGSALPDWMHYDPATGVLSGIAPTGDVREIHVVVTTRHEFSPTTRRDVVISFAERGARSTHGTTVRPHSPHAPLHGAKPSLTDQLASHRSVLNVARLGHVTRPNPLA